MSSRPKILHITSSWENGVGNELAEFTTRLAPEFDSETCVLATLGLRWNCDVSTYLRLGRVLRRFRPDVVHTWDAVAHSYAALHYGIKRILAEKRETESPKGLSQKFLDRKTHRYIVPQPNNTLPTAKTVVIPPAAVPVSCVEPIPAEALLEKLGFPLVEPSGDYYPVFQSQYDPVRRTYKSMSPHQTPFLIGIILPLGLEHRILDALWVFETLSHVHLNYHAFVIGDGKDRETFLCHRDQWKLFSRVHFLGDRSGTHRLLPHFDVLLHLSSSPEYSGTILSAMSCGVPVVALETPESREYIVDGTTGMLIPADGDFRSYRRTAVKRLLYLLENEALRRSMQVAAQERVEKEFNFETAVQRRIDVYRELT
ncbi:MAG: glycosyltransferase [Planctomycetaceae bacterium]|nr:glycosyltransferase [Planctomycetaceae bacterium]